MYSNYLSYFLQSYFGGIFGSEQGEFLTEMQSYMVSLSSVGKLKTIA